MVQNIDSQNQTAGLPARLGGHKGSRSLDSTPLERVAMGNSSSSSKTQDDTVDFGFLTPHGVYSGSRDWNQQIVGQFIVERRLAPFYRPLEDYSDDWDDEHILAARRFPEGEQSHDNAGSDHRVSSGGRDTPPSLKPTKSRLGKEPVIRPTEASLYRGAVECPICFMVRIHPLLLPELRPTFLIWPNSIILQISIVQDAASNPFAQNVSSRSNARSPHQLTLSLNPLAVRIVSKNTLA